MRDNGTVTFIGPATPKVAENGRVTSYSFLLVQPGCDPIEFAYGTYKEVAQARRGLLRVDNAHNIPSQHLLDGVVKALQEAQQIAWKQKDEEN